MEIAKILKERDQIISQITRYAPLYREYFEMPLSIREFSDGLYNFKTPALHLKRQELLKNKITRKFEGLFGGNAKEKLKINFANSLAFNIADHHQILNHPFLLSANVISSVNKFFQKEKADATIVVSSGDVPPNNYFGKSGFCLHGKHVPLFSVAEREHCSYYITKRDFDFVARLKISHQWHEFTKGEQKFLQDFNTFISSINFDRCKDYADQITVIVKETWPLLFPEASRPTLPDLLYITQEELTTQCLLELLKEDNFITAAYFDKPFRDQILENFRGIIITWREREGKGTHFFWRKYPGQPRSLRMYLQGEYLIPADSRFEHLKIHMDKGSIMEKLAEKEIYPSLFSIFSMLNFYSGVRPLTGYGSAIYLSLFKNAWLKTLEHSAFMEEIPLIKNIDTSGLVAGMALFFRRFDGQLKALYAHDIFCDGPLSPKYLEAAVSMKYGDFFKTGAADIYDYISSKYIPPAKKLEKTINFNDLASITFNNL